MRTSNKKLNPSLKRQLKKTFALAIADFKNMEEANVFLNDFLNDSELETYTKRFAIAYWLKKGRSYTNIRDNLKVSSATIADVSQMMKSPGFKLALQKAEAEEWADQWVEKIKKFLKR